MVTTMITGTTMVMIILRTTIMPLARTSTPATIMVTAIMVTAIMRLMTMGTATVTIIITDRSRKSCA